ncbi:hypothetical protein, partial [Aliikangiella maris]
IYGYVAADPVNYFDPTGLVRMDDPMYGIPLEVQAKIRERIKNGCDLFSYSYGSFAGGSAITPAGGVVGGMNGQFFSDGSSDAYIVSGVGWGWDIGGTAEFNFAFHTGDGGAGSWSGRFDSYNFSFGGFTGSFFWGGGWYGISGGVTSDGVAISRQITEYTPVLGSSSIPSSCECE